MAFERQLFRYWVELRDLRAGTTRDLPIAWFRRIALTAKADAEKPPDRLELQVEDVGRMWEAKDLDDLAGQLREHYPDSGFERRLKYERDLDAERRYNAAIEELARLIARNAVEQFSRESED